MNKKGMSLAPELLVVIVVALIVLVILLIYVIPAIRSGSEAPKTFLEQQIEMLKKTGETKISLEELTQSEKEELKNKYPKEYVSMLLNEKRDEFESALSFKNFDKARKIVEEYKKICENPVYAIHCADLDKEATDIMSRRIKQEEEQYQKESEAGSKRYFGPIEKLPENTGWGDLNLKLGEARKVIDVKDYNRAREITLEIVDSIKESQYQGEEAFQNMFAEANYILIESYSLQYNCDATLDFLEILEEGYPTSYGLSITNVPVLKRAYDSLIYCYYYLAYNRKINPEKNYMALYGLFKEYDSRYHEGEKSYNYNYYKQAIFYLGEVNCFDLDPSSCHKSIKKIKVENDIVEIQVSSLAVKKNSRLGCWYNYGKGIFGGDGCDSCTRVDSCDDYETGLGTSWRAVCNLDPCRINCRYNEETFGDCVPT